MSEHFFQCGHKKSEIWFRKNNLGEFLGIRSIKTVNLTLIKKEYVLEIIYAMAGGGGQGGGIAAFLPFIIIMGIIYFLMIRPQSKRQKEKKTMLENLKKGDKVITIGGIHGVISGLKAKGTVVILKTGKNNDLTVNRSAIAGLAGSVTEEDTSIVEN